MTRMQALRLRLLFLAGVLVPVAMLVVGFGLSYLATGAFPGLLRVPPWRSVLLGLIIGGVSMGAIALLGKLSPRLEEALERTGTRAAREALETAGYPVMLLVVTTSALGEESLFRGGLQPLVGLVPAALLFGFSHGGWRRENWAYALAASLSGLVFGLVYVLTGDLWVTVIAHALHNVLSTLLVNKRVVWDRKGIWPIPRLVDTEPDECERECECECERESESESECERGLSSESGPGPATGPEAESGVGSESESGSEGGPSSGPESQFESEPGRTGEPKAE